MKCSWFNFKWHLLGFIPSPPRNLGKASIRDPGGDVRKPSFAHGTWDYQVSGFLTVSPKKGMRMGCGSSKGFKGQACKAWHLDPSFYGTSPTVSTGHLFAPGGVTMKVGGSSWIWFNNSQGWSRKGNLMALPSRYPSKEVPPPKMMFTTQYFLIKAYLIVISLFESILLEPTQKLSLLRLLGTLKDSGGCLVMPCDSLPDLSGNVGNLIHEELSLCRRFVLDMTMWWVAQTEMKSPIRYMKTIFVDVLQDRKSVV